MFTGLIQDVGTMLNLVPHRGEAKLTVTSSFEKVQAGESIAVMGVCLSVVERFAGRFSAFASAETLQRSNLGGLRAGSKVNLERALRVGDPIGGHLVTGHVDAKVEVRKRTRIGEAERLEIALPHETNQKSEIAEKGSVAIDGVSLTVNAVHADCFEVMLIPLTLRNTTLGSAGPGDIVNLETDILAKYVSRRFELKDGEKKGVDLDLLIRTGFVR
jgi:riboflavin synthase